MINECLLTALAPYQIDTGIIEDFRAAIGSNTDAHVVAVAAWSSFAAVRRINEWISAPTPSGPQ